MSSNGNRNRIVLFRLFCASFLTINFLLYAQEPEFASLVYNVQGQGLIKPRTELFYANIPLNMEHLALSQDYVTCVSKRDSEKVYFGARTQCDGLRCVLVDNNFNYFKKLKQIVFNSNQALLYVVQKKQIRCLENKASKTKFNIKLSKPINTYCKNYIITNPYNENDFIYTTGDSELYIQNTSNVAVAIEVDLTKNILNLTYCNRDLISMYTILKSDIACMVFIDIRTSLLAQSVEISNSINYSVKPTTISLMASCPINMLFAFTIDTELKLIDRRKLSSLNKGILWAKKWQELFFVGQTLVAISDEKIFFYDTVQNSHFEYPLIKNGIAKWHPHIQTLSISNPTTQETITYTFPFDMQQMQNMSSYTLNKDVMEPAKKDNVSSQDDVQELFNILDANNLSKSYVQKQYIKACDATIESVKGELCKDPTLVSKAKIALNGPIKKILHNKTDIITDKITYEKYREIVDQKNIIDDILTQLHDTDILAQCLICLDYFKEQISYGQTDNPTVLDCGHIVCKKCHTTLAEKQKDICPLCKK